MLFLGVPFRFLSKGPIRVTITDLMARVHNSCLSYESFSSGFNIFLIPTCTPNPNSIVKLPKLRWLELLLRLKP